MGNVPEYMSKKIKYRNGAHNRDLRNTNEIEVINATKACCCQNSVFYEGIKIFNDLPNEIRDERSCKMYERKMKIIKSYI